MAIKVTQDKTTTVLRNLEEQVLKNKQDIARHYEMDRALANLGIKILGTLVSADELPGLDKEIPFPAAPNYTGEFGDAYAVRTENWTADDPDYVYYVFTRANLNVGEANDYWLNVGKIGIQGDQGPRGERGEQGEPGNAARWYSGSFIPTTAAQEGDMFLVTSAASNGDVYQYTNGQWVKQTNLRGAQGLQGDRGPRGEQGIKGEKGNPGERGEPGRPFSIAGVLASIDYLPIPTSKNRDKAYLVEIAGDETNYDIYFIVGSEESGYLWHNAGRFATVQGPQGNQGEKGDQGIPGFSIFRSSATSIENNTIPLSSITNLEGRAVQVGDLVLIKYSVYNITAVSSNTLTVSQTENNLRGEKGEQGEPGKVEYEVFSISSVYQPDYGIYINLPTIYKEVEVLSIMITPPSGKYTSYYWNSQGVPMKIISGGSFIGGSFPMIKGSSGDSVGKLSGSTLNTNGVLNADGSKGMVTIGLKADNKWSGDDLKTGQPTGIILVKCVR